MTHRQGSAAALPTGPSPCPRECAAPSTVSGSVCAAVVVCGSCACGCCDAQHCLVVSLAIYCHNSDYAGHQVMLQTSTVCVFHSPVPSTTSTTSTNCCALCYSLTGLVPPQAFNDMYTYPPDSISVPQPGVLVNDKYDTACQTSEISVHMVTEPQFGTVQLKADGSFVYTVWTRTLVAEVFTTQQRFGAGAVGLGCCMHATVGWCLPGLLVPCPV